MTDSSDPRPAPERAATATDDVEDTDVATAPDYDPAEYRWVPVRRVPRLDGWTEEKQRRFIEVLADTGLVSLACKAVGMSRESAYKLRRSAHGTAFAQAWDAARRHAGGLIEDIAFERAIEGVEHEIYNDCGEVIGARLVHDGRLLKWLLSHLKPDRYGGGARGGEGGGGESGGADPVATPPALALADSLRAMEPALPAPPEQLLTPDDLAHELDLADIADGRLPRFLDEQRAPKTAAQLAAEEHAARLARGEAAIARRAAGLALTAEELADECYAIDPASNRRRRRRPR